MGYDITEGRHIENTLKFILLSPGLIIRDIHQSLFYIYTYLCPYIKIYILILSQVNKYSSKSV